MSNIKDLLSIGVDGTGTANSVMKWLDTNTATDSIIYDNGTNIGIGTSSPEGKLDVGSGDIVTSTISGGSYSIDGVSYVNANIVSGTGFNSVPVKVGDVITFPYNQVKTVGIVTDTQLTVDSNFAISFSNATVTGKRGVVFNVDNKETLRVQANGFLYASNTGSYLFPAGSYHSFQNLTNSGSDANILSVLGSNNSNTSSYHFIGTCSTSNTIYIYGNGNIANANGVYGSTSDIKLKENIVDASPKLDDILKVKVRNYNLIGDETKQIGVVAQELEEIFPSMIYESPDFENKEVVDEEGNITAERIDLGTTTKSVKYSIFIPMLIKATQELKEIIDNQQIEIDNLKAQLNG